MAGQGTVTIGEIVWTVDFAVTMAELTSGLSGVASIPVGTGMLFDVGSDQSSLSINMQDMLFGLDIVFINSGYGVVGVLHNVEPGEDAFFDAGIGLGARYFMEVNAGEAGSVSVGDIAAISGYTPSTGIDLGQIVQAMIAIGMMGLMAKFVVEPARHSIHGPERARLVKQYGSWAVGRAESVCPEDDVMCVEGEAAEFLTKFKAGRWP